MKKERKTEQQSNILTQKKGRRKKERKHSQIDQHKRKKERKKEKRKKERDKQKKSNSGRGWICFDFHIVYLEINHFLLLCMKSIFSIQYLKWKDVKQMQKMREIFQVKNPPEGGNRCKRPWT